MALSIIALIIALAGLALAIIFSVRVVKLEKEAEDNKWEMIAVENALTNLQEKPAETVVAGLEGVKYDAESSSFTIDGNLTVKGWVVAGDTKEN